MNNCINAAWHGEHQLVVLLMCSGSPGSSESDPMVRETASGTFGSVGRDRVLPES